MKCLKVSPLVLFLISTLAASPALAVGEIFKLETTGTAYCGDFNFAKFNAKNNVDLWVGLDSDIQVTVSFTPTFDAGTTFPMLGTTYLTAPTKAVFVAGVTFVVDGTYVTVQG